jgi:signal transduction histidine kinase
MSTALANARMVAATLPAHVDSIAQIHAAANEDPGRTAGAKMRLARVGGHVQALGDSHGQLAQALDQAERVIAGFEQLAVDQTSGRRRAFDILATVRSVVEVTRLSHRHDPVEIIVTGEPDLAMDSYPGPVGQVLAQLIDNAIVHGFADHREGTIEVRVWPAARDGVRLTVRDDGLGIPPEALAQVYTPFFTTRVDHGGAGLGLTIARNMVTGILGGRIEVVSPPDAGTTVTVTLPRTAPRGTSPQ